MRSGSGFRLRTRSGAVPPSTNWLRAASAYREPRPLHFVRRILMPWIRALTCAALACSSSLAFAEPPRPAPAVQADRLAGLPDFVDGVVAGQIASRQVAGAVVTVVADGRVLFTRGYGFANVAKQVPVDGARTLFRPGSVSKLFTWV